MILDIIIILSSLITIAYCLLMVAYTIGWLKQKEFLLPTNFEPKTFISIIIPARNEEENIAACINSILAQKYPVSLFEILIVDDHSTDNTVEIVENFNKDNIHCFSLANYIKGGETSSYKKAALAAGISECKGELIITTDADCTAPNSWLLHIAAYYQSNNPTMIIAPVNYASNNNLVQTFQVIDFITMQGITAATHALKSGNMSNGANLAFTKAAFMQIDGYEGVDNFASGDDYLLMLKMSNLPDSKIAYLKSAKAMVVTQPQPDWHSFLQQRIRWASKSGKYDDKKLNAILILVYVFNLMFALLFISGIWCNQLLVTAVTLLIIKILAELLLLIPVASFFKKEWLLGYFPFLQPLHILYIIVAGFLGYAGNYEWKGRKIIRQKNLAQQ